MTARILLLCSVALLLAADQPAQDAGKEELDKLQGDWTMVSLEMRGKTAPDDVVKTYKLTVKEDQWTVTGEGKTETSTYKIDVSKDPKTIDRVYNKSDKLPPTLGIYKLDGDVLTICRTQGGRKRPTEFKTTPEAGILVVWKRDAK